MKQAVLQSGMGIDSIRVSKAVVPTPGPGEALVRLSAATVNFRDLIVAKGLIPGLGREPEVIPMSCGAGVVEAIGEGVVRVKPGDRVSPTFNIGWVRGPQTSYDMLGGQVDGVARQYAVWPAESLVRNPHELSDLEAATLPCAGLTAWLALTQVRATQPRDWVLVHGTGGVSIAALQFAKAMGAHVAITSSSDAKLARARSLGADMTINYRATPDWAQVIRSALGTDRIDNVVDTVGATQFEDNASLVDSYGQISAIGMLGSDFSWQKEAKTANVVPIAVGNRDQHEAMLAFIVEHAIRPPVDVVYDLDRIRMAYRTLESGAFFGKVGLDMS